MSRIELSNLSQYLKASGGKCPPFTKIPVLDGEAQLSYEDFFRSFILLNVPCLIRKPCLLTDWPCRSDWRTEEGKACMKHLVSIVPKDLIVPVSDCQKKYFNSQECNEKHFHEFLEYWNNTGLRGSRCLYLKDWHFYRDCRHSYEAYLTSEYFCSDWLNEYWAEKNSEETDTSKHNDYRFVYVGPKGSWTPYHADVFGSFSWSANVTGRKLWIFTKPGEEIKDKRGDLVYDVQHENCEVEKYEVIQESGDVIFVPSLWHHQVINLEDTISVNHNWFNGANIATVLEELLRADGDVKRELSDVTTDNDQAWWELCERTLHAHHGMNKTDFVDLLCSVARRRLALVREGENVTFDGITLGRNHALFDIAMIQPVLMKLSESSSYIGGDLKNKISAVLNNLKDVA